MGICKPVDSFDGQGGASEFGRGDAGPVSVPALPHTPVQLSVSPCKANTRSLRMQQGQSVLLQLQPTDYNGNVVALPALPEVAEEESSSSSSATPAVAEPTDGLVYALLVKHRVADRTILIEKYDGEVVDRDKSIVQFSLGPDDALRAGLYEASLVLFNADQSAMYWSTPYWLEVQAAAHLASCGGPPTISEMRLRLRDACPELNKIIRDYEFTDEEIIVALRDLVDKFNSSRPPITRYTPATFPPEFRYWWVKGATALLLRTVAVHMLRNRLKVEGGGFSTDPNDNYSAYMLMAKTFLEEFDTWMYSTKARLNAEQGYGGVGSSYRYSGRYP